VPRNFSRRHQYRVKPNVADPCIGICCEPRLGSGRDPPPLTFIDRFRGFIEIGARFYLGEHEQPAAARNNIDFAAWAAPPPCQNTEALCDQESGGTAFGGNTDPECGLPLGSWRGL